MCFSAEASFGLSAALLPAGVYCVRCALVKNRDLLCLAVIPLIFGAQQFLEGLVWMGIGRADGQLTRAASLVYLAFALAFWPFWIPFSAFLLEAPGKRKWLFGFVAALGLLGGLILYLPLAWDPALLTPTPHHHAIHYEMERSPPLRWMSFATWQGLYMIVVALPPLLSPSRGFFLFGVAIVLSSAASHVFYGNASPSVWCFFAAVLSAFLCFSFRAMPAPSDASGSVEPPRSKKIPEA